MRPASPARSALSLAAIGLALVACGRSPLDLAATGAAGRASAGSGGPDGSTGTAGVGAGGAGGVSLTGIGGVGGASSSGGAGGGVVSGLKKLGEPCAERIDCESKFCTDGVCCVSSDCGPCEKCALPGSAGLCGPLPAGTVCVQPGCNGNMPSGGFTCDGNGTCLVLPVPARFCAPYACNAATATCNTFCKTDADCFNASCVNGSCGVTPIGAKCALDTDCNTGFCADGQCCNVACQGACVSCAISGHEGTCWPILAGGIDPHGVCVDQGVRSCGNNGRCDGNGGCAIYPPGTICVPQTCIGDTLEFAGRCSGLRTCETSTTTCKPFVCRADAPMCESN